MRGLSVGILSLALVVISTEASVAVGADQPAENSQADASKKPRYRVTLKFSGIEHLANPVETVLVEEGKSVSVPVSYRFPQGSGTKVTIRSLHVFVPARASLSKEGLESQKTKRETIPLGHRMKLRVRRLEAGDVLLDARLSHTRVPQQDLEERRMRFQIASARQVQPVSIGESVTLKWPEMKDSEEQAKCEESHQAEVEISIEAEAGD